MLFEARILLVGDDELVRKETEEVLTRSGFKVASVDNLVDGLFILEEAQLSDNPFQLAVLGLRFSESEKGFLRGSEDAHIRQLFDINPQLPVVLMEPDSTLDFSDSSNNHGENKAFLEETRGYSLVKLIHDILER